MADQVQRNLAALLSVNDINIMVVGVVGIDLGEQ